jgi:hypothetical protein
MPIYRNGKKEQDHVLCELEEEEINLITDLFFRDIVPKLRRLDARIGTVNCEFAGKQYGKWNIHFRSSGPGFDIVDFEYDDESAGLDLDL